MFVVLTIFHKKQKENKDCEKGGERENIKTGKTKDKVKVIKITCQMSVCMC